ncbi:hypothetical protein OROMI_013894 [Orobanche minor]
MARKRAKHTHIPNDRERKCTLKRRLESLYKKANELSILCNIEIFIILLNPNEGNLTLWPSQDEAMNGISKFLNFPAQERVKKMVLQEKLLTDKIEDMAEKVSKLRKKNEETEMRILMKQVVDGKSLDEIDLDKLNGLNHFVDEKLIKLRKRSDELDEIQTQRSVTDMFTGGNHSGVLDDFKQEWPTIFYP